MLLLMLITSCREDSDKQLAYDHNETLSFAEAEKSFAGKFKVMWNGLNQYYALWDYEAEQGLDWDAVYDEYLPQFEALDERGEDDPVTDDELKELLAKVLSPLHDGHFAMIWRNHATGHQVMYLPSTDRNASRDDAVIADKYTPSLYYYANPANGEVVTTTAGVPIALEFSTQWPDISRSIGNTNGVGLKWIDAEIQKISQLTNPTEMDVFRYQQLNVLRTRLVTVLQQTDAKTAITAFNTLAVQYAFLEVPGLSTIDPSLIDNAINVKFALLKGNIAYFYFSGFKLTPYITADENASAAYKNVKTVWQTWFTFIQNLHKAGALGGIIIDVRGNGGGMFSDGQYVVGAFLPEGDFQFGYSRFKRGTGRYEYSPLMPAYMSTMKDEHEVIDDKPIVLLTNCGSVSMSEMTAQVVKIMKNGTVIGKRTYGGLCGLVGNEEHSLNYAGHIGIEGETPIYGYVPSLATFTMDKQQLEGVGITPDIEVALDAQLFSTTGRDTQLDRALQFIRTGN